MLTTQLENLDSLLRINGVDIVKSIFAGEVIRDNGSELRIKPNGAFCYNKNTTLWYDHALGEGGNVITLVAKHHNISNTQAIDWIGSVLNIEPSIIRNREVQRQTIDPDAQSKIDGARNIWNKTMPLKGTNAELYLNKRCIKSHIIPDTFRSWEGSLVAPIYLVRKNCIYTTAVQVTYLDKFAEKIKRKNHGKVKNGAVHLTPYEELGDTLCIAEGSEDGLSYSQFYEGASIWATLGTSGLNSLELPDNISQIILIRDNDMASEKSTAEFKNTYQNKYSIVDAFPPKDCKDWNEYHCKGGKI
tara:strand:+ start:301 stop:1206 length:906 start_codon:yes stop_codon:yes gene_type:complete